MSWSDLKRYPPSQNRQPRSNRVPVGAKINQTVVVVDAVTTLWQAWSNNEWPHQDPNTQDRAYPQARPVIILLIGTNSSRSSKLPTHHRAPISSPRPNDR